MLLEKLSTIALFAGAKATGLLALVGGGVALRPVKEPRAGADLLPEARPAIEAPAVSSERVITVPAQPAGHLAQWQKLECISGEAEDAARRATAAQERAAEELDMAMRDLEELRLELAGMIPSREVA